ncbi:tape measure protein [Alcaligenes aquatilis]|uniref:Tape measure protein n=1 Tax=Alcaligenes aquatilis TaxID=323284 RepID=A0ABY4NN99_9BURK|nr:tape measure protein [Alcaligenes aquatilis]UQN37321.1 tape measure protein [Alcaligenes aquatilis]
MAESVGAIYYTVEAETAKLISDLENANKRLEMLGSGFNKTDASAKKVDMQLTKTASAVKSLGNEGAGAERKIGGLAKMLGGLIAVQGVGGLIQMAEGYNEMAERVRMATSSIEEYDQVQARLLKTANGTYRALAEAQEIYIQTSDGLRSMGYSTDQALDITDSLSYSFVKNATAVDRAQSAMRAYDLALNKGKVDATGWLTVVGAIPSVVGDIAAATGKTDAEIRRMGASGEITARMLNEGLRQSLDANKKAADGMATTVRDAFTNLRTNLSVYIGEANNSTGATQTLAAAIGLLGDNINIVVTALTVIGSGALAKYISSLGLAAIKSGLVAVASRNAAAAALQEAQARHASTMAALAAAQANAALGTNLAALAAAQKAAEASARSLATAQVGAKAAGAGLLGILGGPVGIIALLASAGTAFYMFSDGSDKARATLQEMEGPLDETIAKFRELSNAQREGLIVKYMEAQAQAADDAKDKFNELFASISGVNSFRTDWSMRQWSNFRDEIEAARRAGEDLTPIIKRAAEQSGVSPNVINTWLRLNGELADADQKASDAAIKVGALKNEQHNLAGSARDAAAGQRELNAALAGFDGASGDALKRMQERVAALQDGNSEVKKAARYLATLTDVSEGFKTAYMSAALAADHLTEANKRSTASSQAGNKAAEEGRRAHEQNAKTLQDMAQELAFSALKGEELAIAKANARLNSFATPEEVQEIQRLAAALYQVQQIEQQRQQFGSGQQADQYIMGDTSPLSGGAFDDQYARYEAEAEAEQKRYDDQLERLRQARELQIETKRSYDELEQEAAKQHADRMAQIEQAKNHVMLASASDAFGALAGVMKQSQGEQSGIYKAMFAASKAFAIADATVNAYSAISKAWNSAPFPANLGAVAATTPQVMSVVSAISGASYSGRQYGGPTQPGKMYRINENGAPEVFNAANGQQFMLPNTRGHVVSNRDASAAKGGEGAPRITLNLIEDASRAGQVDQQQLNDEHILNVCVASIRGGTQMAGAIEGTYGVRRQGR